MIFFFSGRLAVAQTGQTIFTLFHFKMCVVYGWYLALDALWSPLFFPLPGRRGEEKEEEENSRKLSVKYFFLYAKEEMSGHVPTKIDSSSTSSFPFFFCLLSFLTSEKKRKSFFIPFFFWQRKLSLSICLFKSICVSEI